jgi:hypothetical protein
MNRALATRGKLHKLRMQMREPSLFYCDFLFELLGKVHYYEDFPQIVRFQIFFGFNSTNVHLARFLYLIERKRATVRNKKSGLFYL